ncbi:hypothetical protein HZ326_16334 [Fusarium oxysporum f. sp. albedinis]|nr:hypothetical protein HZ326_16334 [Fusarium oxysporum f. sp. albedinis]
MTPSDTQERSLHNLLALHVVSDGQQCPQLNYTLAAVRAQNSCIVIHKQLENKTSEHRGGEMSSHDRWKGIMNRSWNHQEANDSSTTCRESHQRHLHTSSTLPTGSCQDREI